MDKHENIICQHCGRVVNPQEKSLGNWERSTGMTEDIVAQAAIDTGLNVYVGPTTCGRLPDDYVGLWRKEDRDLSPFYARAKELGVNIQ